MHSLRKEEKSQLTKQQHSIYILQEIATKKIIKAVLFKENEIQPLTAKEELYQKETILESPNLDLDDERSNEQTKEKPVGDEVGEVGNEVPKCT